MKKTPFLLPMVLMMLAVALNAAAQITPAGPGNLPSAAPDAGNYAPGYTPAAPASPDISNPPAAETHVPESTSFIVGCVMLVPLAVSLVRVLRRKHELS